MKRLWHEFFGHSMDLTLNFPEPISCPCGKKWDWVGVSYKRIVRDDPSEVQCEISDMMWEAL